MSVAVTKRCANASRAFNVSVWFTKLSNAVYSVFHYLKSKRTLSASAAACDLTNWLIALSTADEQFVIQDKLTNRNLPPSTHHTHTHTHTYIYIYIYITVHHIYIYIYIYVEVRWRGMWRRGYISADVYLAVELQRVPWLTFGHLSGSAQNVDYSLCVAGCS